MESPGTAPGEGLTPRRTLLRRKSILQFSFRFNWIPLQQLPLLCIRVSPLSTPQFILSFVRGFRRCQPLTADFSLSTAAPTSAWIYGWHASAHHSQASSLARPVSDALRPCVARSPVSRKRRPPCARYAKGRSFCPGSHLPDCPEHSVPEAQQPIAGLSTCKPLLRSHYGFLSNFGQPIQLFRPDHYH